MKTVTQFEMITNENYQKSKWRAMPCLLMITMFPSDIGNTPLSSWYVGLMKFLPNSHQTVTVVKTMIEGYWCENKLPQGTEK